MSGLSDEPFVVRRCRTYVDRASARCDATYRRPYAAWHRTSGQLRSPTETSTQTPRVIRYEYLTIRTGPWFAPSWPCLLLFELNVEEMGSCVAVGSYVAAQVGFACS
jgi:hypothetical protein